MEHNHSQHNEGCYRCELSRDEVTGLINTTNREYEAYINGFRDGHEDGVGDRFTGTQSEAPVGMLAYIGHPTHRSLIQKRADGRWYQVAPIKTHVSPLPDEEFRAGWYPLVAQE